MMKGWHNESQRHSLAAKGIRTGWRGGKPVRTGMIGDAYEWGEQDARDAFYLGQNQSMLNVDIEEKVIELEGRGMATREHIVRETDELIDQSYRSIVDGLDYGYMKDLFNDYMKQKFPGERLDAHWADAAPKSFDMYVKGYKEEMLRLHNGMRIKPSEVF